MWSRWIVWDLHSSDLKFYSWEQLCITTVEKFTYYSHFLKLSALKSLELLIKQIQAIIAPYTTFY